MGGPDGQGHAHARGEGRHGLHHGRHGHGHRAVPRLHPPPLHRDDAGREAYKGLAWLFLGVANSDALLYDDEWQAALKKYPDNFKVDYALSREQTNSKGGKMYIQDKVEEYADDIFARLENGAVMYFCGLKGMMPGIQEMLKGVCEKKGLVYDDFIAKLKKNGQWRVEVY